MENNTEKKELEQSPKKEWISPEMNEIDLNSGSIKGNELLAYRLS